MVDKDKKLGFESLSCYQHSLKLLEAAYRMAINLPEHEKYNLSSQLRRSALSTLLNIAEGYGRYHFLDKLRYFSIARGSLSETLSAFICAYQIGYIDENQLTWIRNLESEAEKSLNGYMNFIRRQKVGEIEFGSKYINEISNSYYIPDSTEEV